MLLAANNLRISADVVNTRNDKPSQAAKRALVAASEESFGSKMYFIIEPLALADLLSIFGIDTLVLLAQFPSSSELQSAARFPFNIINKSYGHPIDSNTRTYIAVSRSYSNDL
jgi:hypothetical protein